MGFGRDCNAFQQFKLKKKGVKFQKAFACSHPKSRIKIPNFELEDIEDYYTLYVLIFGMSEELFWNVDISFLRAVADNKSAFDNYINVQNEKIIENSKK